MTATVDELRDWLAVDDGWTKRKATGHPIMHPFPPNDYKWFWDFKGTMGIWEHPHHHTRDGAADAMPDGWYWIRDGAATSHRPDGLLLRWVACERGANNWRVVEVPDTGDEIADRYRLAVLCRLAEREAAK